MLGANSRLDEGRVVALIETHWPHQEATQFKRSLAAQKGEPLDEVEPDPPLPVLLEHPSERLDFRTKRDRFPEPCPEGVQWDVMRCYRKSNVRSPVIWHSTEIVATSWHKMSDTNGVPFDSIAALAESMQIEVDSVVIGTAPQGARKECLSKLENCLETGKWLVIVEKHRPRHDLYRDIGRILATLEPQPEKYPGQEKFRLWVKLETDKGFAVNVNDNIDPPFPRIFAMNAVLSTPKPGGRRKIVRPMLSDPYGHPECQHLYTLQALKHSSRAMKGRDSDSESDDDRVDNPDSAQTSEGPWFVRASGRVASCKEYGPSFRPMLPEEANLLEYRK